MNVITKFFTIQFALSCFLLLSPFNSRSGDCPKPPITECPSLYLEQCGTDKAFQEKNAVTCLEVLTNNSIDAASCASFDPDGCNKHSQTEQSVNCSKPAITECPSFYKEQCVSDKKFREMNVLQCLDVVTAKAQDAPHCASFALPKDCCEEEHPLARYFCERRQRDCPVRIKELNEGFGRVLESLNKALEPYSELIALDPKQIATTTTLCEYTTKELDHLKELAMRENQKLAEHTEELASLRVCHATILEFMERGRPDNINTELWDSLIGLLTKELENVNSQEGEIKTKIEKLRGAPERISDLRIVHKMGC